MEPVALLHDTNVVILLAQLERDIPRAVSAPAALVAYRPGIANAHSYAASLLTAWLSMQAGPLLRFHDLRGSPTQPAYLHLPDNLVQAAEESSSSDDSPGDGDGAAGGRARRDRPPPGPRRGPASPSTAPGWGEWMPRGGGGGGHSGVQSSGAAAQPAEQFDRVAASAERDAHQSATGEEQPSSAAAVLGARPKARPSIPASHHQPG